MKQQSDFDALRRRVLLVAGGIAAGFALPVRIVRAQAGKTTKQAAQYQEGPKDGKQCKDCQFFQPGTGGAGTCQLVDGEISPNGWCMLFTAKTQ